MIKIEIDLNSAPDELYAASEFINKMAKLREPRTDKFLDEEQSALETDANSSTGRTVEKFRVEQNEIPAPPSSGRGERASKMYFDESPTATKFNPPDEVGVDSRGLAWNPEIHSETKAKNKDGAWRYRRKVDKNLIVELEEAAMPVQEDEVPAPPAQRVIPLATGPGSVRMGAETFIDLMKKINSAKLAGRITQERIQEISFQVIGDKNLSKLSTQQDMIPEVSAIIDAELLM